MQLQDAVLELLRGGFSGGGAAPFAPPPPLLDVSSGVGSPPLPLHASPQPLPQTIGAREGRRCGSATFLEGATGPIHR